MHFLNFRVWLGTHVIKIVQKIGDFIAENNNLRPSLDVYTTAFYHRAHPWFSWMRREVIFFFPFPANRQKQLFLIE